MPPRPDAGLEVALEQRQRIFDAAQAALAERARGVAEQAERLATAQSRVRMVLQQMDAAQRPSVGGALPVVTLGDLELLLDWCEQQVLVHERALADARAAADEARGALTEAHKGVRALELVLAARAAERAEKLRRIELREADETAARVHQRQRVASV